MGLGLYLFAEPKPRGFLRRVPAAESLLEAAAETLCRTALEQWDLLKPFVRAWQSDDEWLVRIHPADEEVRVSVDAGRILFSARTNGAGPGYHAFLVNALDRVAERCALRFLPTDDDSGDETGYFEHRDFAELQQSMLQWLKAVSDRIASDAGADTGGMMISMAIGTPFQEPANGVLTPVGSLPRSFFEDTAGADSAALERSGASFFPWWQEGAGDEAAGGLARTLLVTLPWHPPESDDERMPIELALACFDSAPRALRASGVSELDVAELRNLLRESSKAAKPPRPLGFGVMRGPVRRHAYPGVSLVLPGYYYELHADADADADDDDDDDDAKVYWFGDRVVRVTSFTIQRDGVPAATEELLARAQSLAKSPLDVRSSAASDELEGWVLSFARSDEATGGFHAHGGVARPGRLALLTLSFCEPSDFDWAEEVVRSVRISDSEPA